jgi:peptidoglycan hydrolase CwlO-like protein
MPARALLVMLSLAVSLSTACSFSIGYEFDKASPIVDQANALNTDAAALVTDATNKYGAIYDEAQKSDDPFEELAKQDVPLKKLEPQLESAKSKLRDASQKLDEAAKLNLPDWYRQYLSTLSDLNRAGSETVDLLIQVVKNTYDPDIKTPEDLDAKQKELQDKIAAVNKRRDELRATKSKIEAEHKDQFKS